MNIDSRVFREAIAKIVLAMSVAIVFVAMTVVTYCGMLPYLHRR